MKELKIALQSNTEKFNKIAIYELKKIILSILGWYALSDDPILKLLVYFLQKREKFFFLFTLKKYIKKNSNHSFNIASVLSIIYERRAT